jgi:hypothetical protein
MLLLRGQGMGMIPELRLLNGGIGMKGFVFTSVLIMVGFCWVAPAAGQDMDSVERSSVTTMAPEGVMIRDIKSPVFLEDAVPQPTDTMNFSLGFDYRTDSGKGINDAEDDFGVNLTWLWGPCTDVEVSLNLPVNLGDGGDGPNGRDGNGDLIFGLMYRLVDEDDWMPAFALSGKLRTPTGDRSNGVDGELRGILTKSLVGDLRGHFNAFAITINGDNDMDARNFQWGFVVGLDAPLTDARDLYLIVDYLHRSSEHYGVSNMNIVEAGLDWEVAVGQRLHFTTQVGLDDNGDTPNFGARVAYTYELAMR